MMNNRPVTWLRAPFVARTPAGPIPSTRVVLENGDYRNYGRHADQHVNDPVHKRSLAAANLPKDNKNRASEYQRNGYPAKRFHNNPSGETETRCKRRSCLYQR